MKILNTNRFGFAILALALLLVSCEPDKEINGQYKKTTTDSITIRIVYKAMDSFVDNPFEDEAHVTVYGMESGAVDSTAIYVDGDLIENISYLPWSHIFRIGWMNADEHNHEFWLIHTNNGITDTLICPFIVEDSPTLLFGFIPINN